MSTGKQTHFDFDSLRTDMVLSVNDFRAGDKVTVRKDAEGNCLVMEHVQGTSKEGEDYSFDAIKLNVVYKGEEVVMRLSKTTAKKLGSLCNKDQTQLDGKTFAIEFKGSGKFTYIDLLLTNP